MESHERNDGAVITMADNVIHGGGDTYNCSLCREPIVDGERVYLDVHTGGLTDSGVFAMSGSASSTASGPFPRRPSPPSRRPYRTLAASSDTSSMRKTGT